MSGNCRPIGFFDSGVGGISVLKTAFKLLPNENYIYYGDNANAPYGEKTEAEIKELSLAAGRFLFDKGVKTIVMACNTATSAAVKMLREELNIPVISMEPAVKPALSIINNGKVLVLATNATISQARYLGLLKRLGAIDKVINVGCGGLVEMIEDGNTGSEEIHAYLRQKLSDVNSEKISAAVIGCTHYSFIKDYIKSYINNNISMDCKMFDGREGTVNQLRRILIQNNISCESGCTGKIEYYTSGAPHNISNFKSLFEKFHP